MRAIKCFDFQAQVPNFDFRDFEKSAIHVTDAPVALASIAAAEA